MKRIEREYFNAERCKKELFFQLQNQLVAYFYDFFTLVMPVALIAGVVALGNTQWQMEGVRWFVRLIWLIPAPYLIGPACYGIWKWLKISNMPFTVVEDTLCGSETIPMRTRGGFHIEWGTSYSHHLNPFPYYRCEFHFDHYGKFVASSTHFVWSREYRMHSSDLARDSRTGDTFYLLIAETGKKKKQKIVLIYPAKYFCREDERTGASF